MRRYLVVAHQTLASSELLDAMKAEAAQEETAFHLVVPASHGGTGASWTEGQARGRAQHHLDEALARLTGEGLTVTGEVGCDSPAYAVDDVLIRDGSAEYAGIIVSTLPHAISKWLKVDVPARIQRSTTLPVQHVISQPVDVRV